MSVKFTKKGDFFEQKEPIQQVKFRILKEIAILGLSWYKKGFVEGGGRTDKGKWVPRANNFEPERAILVKTKNLSRSLKVDRITQNEAVLSSEMFGTAYDYAIDHNSGDPSKRLPQREFLGVSTPLNKNIEKVVEKMIKQWLTGK